MLEVIRDLAWFCSLLCYCVRMYPLHVTSAWSVRQTKLHITWCLIDLNNICDLLRNAWRTTNWVIHDILSLNLSSIFFYRTLKLKNFHPTLRKKVWIGDERVVLATLLKLPQSSQNLVICIGKGDPNNFA